MLRPTWKLEAITTTAYTTYDTIVVWFEDCAKFLSTYS